MIFDELKRDLKAAMDKEKEESEMRSNSRDLLLLPCPVHFASKSYRNIPTYQLDVQDCVAGD